MVCSKRAPMPSKVCFSASAVVRVLASLANTLPVCRASSVKTPPMPETRAGDHASCAKIWCSGRPGMRLPAGMLAVPLP
ncbi:hypothetical protein FQZ97_1231110 [compost metagenome]